MYYLIFCVAAILLLSALMGLRRGLFKTVFGFLALIISIAAFYFFVPIATDYIMEYTEIDDRIEDRIYKKIETDTQKQVAESLRDAGIKKDVPKLTKEETLYILENDPDKDTQIKKIDELNLPGYIKNSFIENNNDDIYKMLGVESFYRYIARYSARLVVKVMTMVLTFVLIRLLLFVISLIIRRSMEENDVLSVADRIMGMILGLVVGIVIVWIFMVVASIAFGSSYDEMIRGNAFLETINDFNIITKLMSQIM